MSVLEQINKKYGDGSILAMNNSNQKKVHSVIPTGSLGVDLALGIGGIARSRIVEIYGPESSGKTTLCQHIIAEGQALGGKAAFVDVEHALDISYAEKCGVNVDSLYVSQPDTAEQALDIAEMIVRSGEVDIVVLDSIAALVPRAEIEGEVGDSHMGLTARLMGQILRRVTGAVGKSNCMLIFTNQLRDKIGGFGFGPSETTTGGNALKFYASIRFDIRRIQTLKEGTDAIGNRTRVTVKKNKLAPPYKKAEFDIMYNQGISKVGEVLDIGSDLGIIDKRASYYYFEDGKIGQGRENTKLALSENTELLATVENKIRQYYGLPLVRYE